MSQASVKLIPKLRFKLSDRRNLKNPDGPKGRHAKIQKTVTALLRHERLELNYNRADECRGYAERLISDAIKYGDCHRPTMEMASYWIIDKPIIHKLFKVLAPRYQNFDKSYTKMWKAPNVYPGYGFSKCVLELRNNIYPPLGEDKSYNKNLLHNILLSEARKEYMANKSAEESSQKASSASDCQEGGSIDVTQQVVASEVNNEEKNETTKDSTDVEDLDLNELKILELKENESSSEKKSE